MKAEKKGTENVESFSDFNEKCVQLFKATNEYHAAGFSKRKIARMLGVSRQTVIKYVGGDYQSLCQKKLRSGMDAYHDYIVKALKAGMSRIDVYENVVAKGFKGKRTSAYDYMNKLVTHYGLEISMYKSSSEEAIQKRKSIERFDYITRAGLFKFLWMNSELSPEHKDYVFKKYPQIYELYVCIKEFRQIFDSTRMPLLYLFIEKYEQSEIKALSTFSKGLGKDIEAVENAVSCNLSNGFVEGMVSKLKMTKRIMYGRARCALLAAKMMYNASR